MSKRPHELAAEEKDRINKEQDEWTSYQTHIDVIHLIHY